MTTTTLPVQFPGLVAGTWVIDPGHSDVSFTVRHLMSKVRGQFTTFEGALTIVENPLESSATATVDLSSVDTRNEMRDNHLRSADFFSVDDNTSMTFTTSGISADDGDLVATGDLTIKGVSKPVELSVEFLGVEVDPFGETRLGLEANTVISRKEWGITTNVPLDGGKVLIGDTVNVSITIEAVHQV